MTWNEECDWWKRYLGSRNLDEIEDDHVRWNCAKIAVMASFPLTVKVPKIPPALREFALVEIKHACEHLPNNEWALLSLSEALGWAISLRDTKLCDYIIDVLPVNNSGEPEFKDIPEVIAKAYEKIYKHSIETAWQRIMASNC